MNKTIIKGIIMALFFSILLIVFLGNMTLSVMGIEYETSLSISQYGITEIKIPPVGSITARTHSTPVKLTIILQSINIDTLQQMIKEAPPPQVLTDELKAALAGNVRIFVLRIFILAILGGVIGSIIISGNNIKSAIWGAAAGLVLTGLLLGLTYSTYRVDGLRTPEYHGALRAAPWAIDMAEKAFYKFNELGDQMQVIAANLYNIFEQIDNVKPLEKDTDDLLVLHVSDIHNNPASHKFIRQIVKSFPVDMVIDTGDITDYGTPIESQLLSGLMELEIPYLFIPGNHDSPEIMKELSNYPQIQVLTGGIVDVQGLRILAWEDPSSASAAITTANSDAINKAIFQIKKIWQDASRKPHLIAVHNFRMAEQMIGKAPLILYGHSHQYSITEEKSSVLICPGTSGGAGIRGLQATKEIPYSVVLLHFRKNEENELILSATDTIKLFNLEKGFTLERKLFSR